MRKGYTLVELMVVVAVLGLITAIAIPAALQFRYDKWMLQNSLKKDPELSIFYNEITGDIVEVNESKREIISVFGKIEVPNINEWKKWDSHIRRKHIRYNGEPNPSVSTSPKSVAVEKETPSIEWTDGSRTEFIEEDGRVIIKNGNISYHPKQIVFNGSVYTIYTATFEDPKSIDEDPKYKYINESFGK